METGQQASELEVIRSEEQLAVSTHSEVIGRVRIFKRIITEERVLTVRVRREELVVEHLPADTGAETGASMSDTASGRPEAASAAREDDASSARRSVGPPVLELVLHEEEVEVVTRVVPRERIQVFVDTVETPIEVSEQVAHEVVEVDGIEPSRV